MIDATRRWLRRNRTKFAVGFGAVGVGYVVGQYALRKLAEARERMSIERIARDNLRRRFEQNQEDCTFTVLALLPTAAENILEALPVENITHELQQQKAERLGRAVGSQSDLAPSVSSKSPSTTEDDGRSLSSFQTESFLHTSQLGGSGDSGSARPKKSKAQLWSELKIESVTRTFTLLYTLSLLTLLTRIQLNLLGRRNYLSSVLAMATPSPPGSSISLEDKENERVQSASGNDFEVNRKFLTFSWWLLHRGWRDIKVKVEDAVREVFGPINPREDVSYEKLSLLIIEVRKRVEGESAQERKDRKWLPYLLPPTSDEEFVLRESGMIPSSSSTAASSPLSEPPSPTTSSDPSPSPPTTIQLPLRRLLDETSDLIDSPTFTHVLTLLLDTAFSYLNDQKLRTQAFHLPPPSLDPVPPNASDGRIVDVSDTNETDPKNAKAKLAIILAAITKQAHAIGTGVPNEYVQALENVREVEAFAAVIYSSNFEGEIAETARGGEPVESMSAESAEAVVSEGGRAGATSAPGVVGYTWSALESVWGRVSGR